MSSDDNVVPDLLKTYYIIDVHNNNFLMFLIGLNI